MGMLDAINKGTGMLNGMAPGLMYLQARRMGVSPLEAMSQMQQMQSEEERARYYADARKAEEEKIRREQEAEQRRADMAKAQTAAGSAVDMMTPEQKAQFSGSAAMQAWLRGPDADKGISEGLLAAAAPPASGGFAIKTLADGRVVYLPKDPTSGEAPIDSGMRGPVDQGVQAPADLQVFEAFKKMTPEEREMFLKTKRAAPEPSSVSQRFVSAALDNQARSMEQAGKIRTLANDIATVPDAEWIAGAPGRLTEFAKRTFGVEDNVTLIRTLANEVSMAKALSILPPGVASDRDVALAMSTTLPPTTNKQALLSWLRGAQKIAELRAQHANFQLQHMQNDPVTGLFTVGPAWEKYSKGLYDGKDAPAADAPEGMPDVTTMSDEELRAIAEGQ